MPVVRATDTAKQAWAWIKYQAQGKGWLLDPALKGANDQFASDVIQTLGALRKGLTSQRRFLPAENLSWWIQAYSRFIGSENKTASAILKLIHKVVTANATRPDSVRALVLTPGKPEYEVDRPQTKTTVKTPAKTATKTVSSVKTAIKETDAGPNYSKIEDSGDSSFLTWLAIGVGVLAATM